jgi:hypothetical protein
MTPNMLSRHATSNPHTQDKSTESRRVTKHKIADLALEVRMQEGQLSNVLVLLINKFFPAAHDLPSEQQCLPKKPSRLSC